jgi:hypothetical protein
VFSAGSGSAECEAGDGFGPECPRFTIQSRVYDALDPTGQKFSASVINREISEPSDIVIPFSNFIMRGPRGIGRFECVGAITIAMSFSGFGAVELRTGAFFTNGAEGLTPLPATPAEDPTVAVPLEVSVNDSVVVNGDLSAENATAVVASTPAVEDKALEQESVPAPLGQPAAEPVAPRLPSMAPAAAPERPREEEPQEVIYGEVVG